MALDSCCLSRHCDTPRRLATNGPEGPQLRSCEQTTADTNAVAAKQRQAHGGSSRMAGHRPPWWQRGEGKKRRGWLARHITVEQMGRPRRLDM